MATKGYEVVGIGHSSGEYQGHNYNNTLLYCTFEDERVTGLATLKVTVKDGVYNDNPVGVSDIIDLNYDKFGKVKDIVLIEKGMKNIRAQAVKP